MTPVRALLGEHDPARQQRLVAALSEGRPHVVITLARCAEDVVRLLETERFDCVVVDGAMPPGSASELLQRASGALRDTPVIVLWAEGDARGLIDAFRSGLTDAAVLADALRPGALWERVERAILSAERARALRRRAERREKRLVRLADTDPLTGLANRRRLDRLVACARLRSDRRARIACAVLDVDHFKRVNDRHGHAAGDEVLRAVAGAIRRLTPPGASAFRLGGEEFLVLYQSGQLVDAWTHAERLRRAVDRLRFGFDPDLRVTLSAGVACFPRPALSRESIGLADHALYLAKDLGRDRVCSWEMVAVDQHACEVELMAALDAEGRRREFLRRVARTLGPVQLRQVTTHCEQAAMWSERIARTLGISPAGAERVRLAGLMHDLGKCASPEELLAKPISLSATERAMLRSHLRFGASLAGRLGADDATCEYIRAQPAAGGSAEAELLGARLLAVADAIASMTADRPYARATPLARALVELRRGSFDPVALAAAERAATTGAIAA